MNRNDALDLIPLLAADDLAADQRQEVEAAIADDAEAQGELAFFGQLDGWLREAYPASEEPAWLADLDGQAEPPDTSDIPDTPDTAPPVAEDVEQAPLLVRRQCPFCHDALGTTDVVFCTQCATPHHDPCFSENHGCALLGCGGVECVATRSAASRLCASCQGHTPSNAPFCAWCGSPMTEGGQPLHQRKIPGPPALGLRKFLAAAALLLVSGLGVGGFFGVRERPLLRSMISQANELDRVQTESAAQSALQRVAKAQEVFLTHDLDGDDLPDYAEDLQELRSCIDDDDSPETRRLRGMVGYPSQVEVVITSSFDHSGPAFRAVARPGKHLRDSWPGREGPFGDELPPPRAFEVDETGVIRPLDSDSSPGRSGSRRLKSQ